MKDSDSMKGGNFSSENSDHSTFLLSCYSYASLTTTSGKLHIQKCSSVPVERFKNVCGVYSGKYCCPSAMLHSFNISPFQNEPESSNPTLPSALYTTSSQASVAVSLRKLFNSNGFTDVKVIGYEHNWDDAATYATQLVRNRHYLWYISTEYML